MVLPVRQKFIPLVRIMLRSLVYSLSEDWPRTAATGLVGFAARLLRAAVRAAPP
jgi:hypothetical protein